MPRDQAYAIECADPLLSFFCRLLPRYVKDPSRARLWQTLRGPCRWLISGFFLAQVSLSHSFVISTFVCFLMPLNRAMQFRQHEIRQPYIDIAVKDNMVIIMCSHFGLWQMKINRLATALSLRVCLHQILFHTNLSKNPWVDCQVLGFSPPTPNLEPHSPVLPQVCPLVLLSYVLSNSYT